MLHGEYYAIKDGTPKLLQSAKFSQGFPKGILV